MIQISDITIEIRRNSLFCLLLSTIHVSDTGVLFTLTDTNSGDKLSTGNFTQTGDSFIENNTIDLILFMLGVMHSVVKLHRTKLSHYCL
jgi:hypothetical protein